MSGERKTVSVLIRNPRVVYKRQRQRRTAVGAYF